MQLLLRETTGIIEEVKWKKPSNPMGVPVWSRDGIICIGDTLKNAVRLTFPKGHAIANDPTDNIVLECALSSGAKYIVTRDQHSLHIFG